jgi:Protein of unknown function (DUF3237)
MVLDAVRWYHGTMRLSHLCTLKLSYVGKVHLLRPYGNESGAGWGIGEGTVSGDRLSGSMRWSNHPGRRGDGTMLPGVRGFIQTPDEAEVMIEMSGRTTFDGSGIGHQLLFALFESADPSYTWLNNVICVAEGRIDPATTESRIEVHLCETSPAAPDPR